MQPYQVESQKVAGTTPTATVTTEAATVQELHGAGKARYALTALLIVIFAALLATDLFVFLSEMDSNPEKAGESLGKSIIPLGFWFVLVVLAWRGISTREPKYEAQFRVRHRRFMIAVAAAVIVLVGSGLGLGIWNSHRVKIADAIRKIGADNADLQVKGAEFRRQLQQIRQRDTPTMQDYYNQCAEIEKLLDDYEPNRQRALSVVHEIAQIASPDDKSSAAMLRGMDEVWRFDDQMMRDLRQEIAYSKVLIKLPVQQQTKFYNDNILPLYDHESDLAAKETKKLEELRNLGVQLPADMFPKK